MILVCPELRFFQMETFFFIIVEIRTVSGKPQEFSHPEPNVEIRVMCCALLEGVKKRFKLCKKVLLKVCC